MRKRYDRIRCITFTGLAALLFLGAIDERAAQADRLSVRIASFDNEGEAFIPTLLRISAEFKVPIGIEMILPEALEQPTKIRMKRGTIKNLLDMCVQQRPEYAWKEIGGIINFYGLAEASDPSNLFNLVIPSFEVRDGTIDDADFQLRIALLREKEKVQGILGTRSTISGGSGKRLSIKLEGANVREVLNRMVGLDGSLLWVASLPPDRLSAIPQRGLWTVIPMDHFLQKQFRSPIHLKPILGLLGR